MRKTLGTAFVLLGAVLMLAALGLYAYNRYEDQQAAEQVQTVLQDLQQTIEPPAAQQITTEAVDLTQLDAEMPVVTIDGNDYVGYLEIPDIDVNLPVQSEWSYPKLKKTPCRQFGSSRTDDLVIAAHNYESHFGKIVNLASGAPVILTDMDDIRYRYEVKKIEVLAPTETEAVKDSEYDLVLYTCTYGGKTRIVVYCSRVAAERTVTVPAA